MGSFAVMLPLLLYLALMLGIAWYVTKRSVKKGFMKIILSADGLWAVSLLG